MKTYTAREIAYQLGISPKTVSNDVKFLKLKPVIGDRGSKLYNKNDFDLISQLRKHCLDKSKTRDSFVPLITSQVIEDEPVVTSLKKESIDSYSNLPLNPFYDLEMLQKVVDNNYLLPTSRIAPLIDLSCGYLIKQKSYFYCGFIITQQLKANNQIYWKVQKHNSL